MRRPQLERRRHARHDETGAGTLLGLSMVMLLVTTALAAAVAVGIVAAHRTAQAAADLGALAGAAELGRGGDGCTAAADVVRRNGASLDDCRASGFGLTVVVHTRSPRVLGRTGDLRARARAGPVDEGADVLAPSGRS